MGSTCADLAERVREALSDAGVGERSYANFVGEGTRMLLESLSPDGADEWSAARAIGHLRSMWEDVERGELDRWVFQYMRKAAALMNEMDATGMLSGNTLPHYRDENPLVMLFDMDKCSALAEADAGIYSLAAKTAAKTAESGMYQHADQRRKVAHGLSLIVARFVELGHAEWSHEVLDAYVEERERSFARGEISYTHVRWTRVVSMLIRSVAETGEVRWSPPKRGYAEPLDPALEGIVSDFARSSVVEGLAKTTVDLYAFASRELLRELDARGVSIPLGITPRDVRDAVTAVRARKGGETIQSGAACALLRYLSLAHPGLPDLSPSVPPPPPRRRRAIKGFDAEQSRAVLESPDRGTPTGARDFAVVSLAHATGLRSIDVAELTLDAIDWRDGVIRIVQHKTASPLAIPLDAEAGNAIATYILHVRPKTDDPRVFIRRYRPHVGLSAAAIGTIVRLHARTALGVDIGFPAGTYAFRRGFGTGMTEAGVSIDQTMELMGHNRRGTTQGYIYPSTSSLVKCPLDLRGIPNSREELR